MRFPVEISHYLNRFCEFSLNLAALAACCTDVMKRKCVLTEAVPNSVSCTAPNSQMIGAKWQLSLIACIIVTAGVISSSGPSFVGSTASELSSFIDSCSPLSSRSLTREILFIRLLRLMICQGHWRIGHQSHDWWAICLTANRSSDANAVPLTEPDYLRSLFGSSMSCPLLAIVNWIRRVGEHFCSMDDDKTEPSVITSESVDSTPENSTLDLVRLLFEFSSFVAILAQQNDVHWPDTCPCKSQIYATLVSLAIRPLSWLFSLPITMTTHDQLARPNEIARFWTTRAHYISAFGQLSRALTCLLWRHGESCFQTYTDSLPSYFFLISGLSNWIQQSKTLLRSCHTKSLRCVYQDSILRPELIEELYDFDSTAECSTKI